MTVFKERVRELRPAYLPPDPAGRTSYEYLEPRQPVRSRRHDRDRRWRETSRRGSVVPISAFGP